jgi:uncharacterized damage-inducible protein DinB
MEPFFKDCIERLRALHSDIEKCLSSLPSEALGWQPGPDMNSLAVLAAHTAGAQRYWIGDMLAGDPSQRVRAGEFEFRESQAQALIDKLRKTLAHSEATLSAMRVDDLDEVCTSAQHGRDFSLAFCLLHALDHTALHLGHMELTRQLWDQQQG